MVFSGVVRTGTRSEKNALEKFFFYLPLLAQIQKIDIRWQSLKILKSPLDMLKITGCCFM